MSFYYPRQIRFHETDGAGVVYFANLLTLCHEAYEASLGAVGIDLADFFSPQGLVVPVVHGSLDCLRPLVCGDRLTIALSPRPLPQGDRPLSEFEIHYRLLAVPAPSTEGTVEICAEDWEQQLSPAQTFAQATTRHVCIDAASRRRQVLPPDLAAWLQRWQATPGMGEAQSHAAAESTG